MLLQLYFSEFLPQACSTEADILKNNLVCYLYNGGSWSTLATKANNGLDTFISSVQVKLIFTTVTDKFMGFFWLGSCPRSVVY